MDQDGPGVLGEHRVELGDVIVVMVGQEHVGQRELAATQVVEQRRHRTAGVDHHGVPAQLVGDDVGVGQPLVAHRALDDHGPDLIGVGSDGT